MSLKIKLMGIVLSALACGSSLAKNSRYTFISQAACFHFFHNNGAFCKRYLPETLGPGCAFIDYDNDGYPDIVLINGTDFPGHAAHGSTTLKLYHNNRNGTFTDVTARSGLAIPMYGIVVAIGDYDNDGYDDIFISALGQ